MEGYDEAGQRALNKLNDSLLNTRVTKDTTSNSRKIQRTKKDYLSETDTHTKEQLKKRKKKKKGDQKRRHTKYRERKK